MAKVVVYSKVPCPYCVRVKRLLDARGIEFEEIDINGDMQATADLTAKTGMMTLPQVFVGDEFIGGFQETAAADQSGQLATLVAV